MATKEDAKFACAVCEKRQSADFMVYSRHTRNHYCRDTKSCDRRVNARHSVKVTS